jgi:ubiquinone/menaquinone biosynthesis C-methylase UbiE
MIVPPVPAGAEALGFAKARARRVRAWWEDVFSEEWLRLFPAPPDVQIDREVDFIAQSLGVEKGGWVLDVGCGMGRHAVRLAKRGYQVVGVDLSLSMLARCAEEAQGAGAKISFLHADMRELTFADTYDGAYCIGTTFGYFDDDQNAGAIAGIHRALKPKGLFLLETVNRDYVVRQLPSLVWFEGEGCVCMEESTFNPITSRLVVRRTMIANDGGQKTADYSVRLYCLHEIGSILHAAGFRVAEVSGSIATPGAFFDAESPQAWILAEKRVAGSRGTISSSALPAVQPPPPPARAGATAPADAIHASPPTPPPRPAPPPAKAAAPDPDPDPAPERTWIPPASSPLADEKTPPPRRSALPTRPDMPLPPLSPPEPRSSTDAAKPADADEKDREGK